MLKRGKRTAQEYLMISDAPNNSQRSDNRGDDDVISPYLRWVSSAHLCFYDYFDISLSDFL